MNIGIAKFGTVINETDGLKNKIGHMIEVFNLIDILSKEHNVYIINKLNKPIKYKAYNGERLDKLIVFNGPIGTNNTTKFGHKTLQMLERYTWPVIDFINNFDGDWVYLQPDNRYTLKRINSNELKKQPMKTITLKGDDDYFGLDKLWMYQRRFEKDIVKDVDFGFMYNDTKPRRTKVLKEFLTALEMWDFSIKTYGNIHGLTNPQGSVEEADYINHFKKFKSTVNIGTDRLQVTPRIWDSFMYDVIGFIHEFDMGFKVVPYDHFLRVRDGYELADKIELLIKDKNALKNILEFQRSQVKDEYLDGSYILRKFNDEVLNV